MQDGIVIKSSKAGMTVIRTCPLLNFSPAWQKSLGTAPVSGAVPR